MSSTVQNNQRGNNGNNRSRNHSGQAVRSQWVPRGSVPTGSTSGILATPIVNGTDTNVNEHNRQENVEHVQQMNRNRVHQGFRGNGNGNRFVNQRREFNDQMNHNRVYYGGRGNGTQRRGRGRGRGRGRVIEREEREPEEAEVINEEEQLTLPILVHEIQDKLTKGTVECMICYDMVRRSAPIWSCTSCYSIFHLNCIKKWAKAPTSVDLSAEKSQGFNWRCPGCQNVQLTSLREIHYVCFCGKRQDPPSDLYLTPHSCGEPCGKALEKEIIRPGININNEDLCPHICVVQCHPGPCPPCKAFAPPRRCPCGKKVITTRCSDRKSVLTCGSRCDKLLECQRHQCERPCHAGPCDTCQVVVNASCFCKKKTEVVYCGDMSVKGEVKVEDGVFSCNSICEKKLTCENHKCSETCHPGPCGECVLLPSKIKTCCCGKTELTKERQSCLDPIPTCEQICEKTLICGVHKCEDKCHTYECIPCVVFVSQKCRCKSTSREIECYRTLEEFEFDFFTCDKPCGKKKNCGRHRCSERCCPISNTSTEWDPHFCSMTCGKKLRCGQHFCETLCHTGHCPPCLETIFTDLSCPCGKTSIPPPLACGTPPPSCQYPCSVPQPCGHPPSHSCHFGDCPPCNVPVSKECIGGHVVLRSLPCGSKDIRCNKLCGKTRQCGLHACARTCHPPPCDTGSGSGSGSGSSCGQTCGAPRRECRHTCTSLCHPGTSCPDTKCDFPVTITCSCGRITASVPCGNGGQNLDTVFEASVIQKLPVPLQPIETNKKIPLNLRKLTCDDECAKVERKKVLSDAFGITSPNLDSLHFGENVVVSELLRRDTKWVLSVEDRCKFLVLGKSRGGINAPKVHVFCPMIKEKRDAIKLIAERWKLSVNSAGWEPKRFVVIYVTPKSKPPTRMLGVKGSNLIQASVFDPTVDIDPRLVVALFDQPRDADISALVLRFGGECELVWLNDKNALAVFSNPARAATAMRRLDQGSVYYGAVIVHPQNNNNNNNNNNNITSSNGSLGWGVSGSVSVSKDGVKEKEKEKENSWKKAVVHESSWGDEEWSNSNNAPDLEPSVWKGKDVSINASVNQWSVLESETTTSSKQVETSGSGSGSSSVGPQEQEVKNDEVQVNEVDDWEKAYDNGVKE